MIIHTGETPDQCNVCECACKQWGHLILHRTINTGENLINVMFVNIHAHIKVLESSTIEFILGKSRINVMFVNMHAITNVTS